MSTKSKTIYSIQHNDPSLNLIYVGSTKNLKSRLGQHKFHSKHSTGDTRKLYELIRANGGWDAFKVLEHEIVTGYPPDFLAKEAEWKSRLGDTMCTYQVRGNCGDTTYYHKHKAEVLKRMENKRTNVKGQEAYIAAKLLSKNGKMIKV